MQKITRFNKISLVILIIGVLVFSNGCAKGGTQAAKDAYKPVTLVYWSVFNDQDALSDLLTAYQQARPNVTIEYRKFRYDEYDQQLLEALAEDRGPDVFSVRNTMMQQEKAKLLPLPSQTIIPVKSIEGTIKKEEVISMVPRPSITPLAVRQKFLDVVGRDVIMPYDIGTPDNPKAVERVWGLPLNIDALVLYYNKDLLSNAGIVEPPANWTDFQAQAKKITKIDQATGNILISGAAIGAAGNVSRYFDILSLLMMQNLAPMLDDNGNASFDKMPPQLAGASKVPGQGALEYYTQFASPLFEGYSWNAKMPNSLDAFMNGKAAYYFGYSYDRATIRARAPKLNYAVAPVPQISSQQKVNYANYWVEAVSNKTKFRDYAWDFVQFIADEKNVAAYLNKNKKPTALRSTKLINEELADPDLLAFADELLTARSWYRGYNVAGAEKIFADMINSLISGAEPDASKALKQAAERINLIIKRKQ
ncbi:MAG: extracellular solute-binding protein [Parcubacteria group bacterium]